MLSAWNGAPRKTCVADEGCPLGVGMEDSLRDVVTRQEHPSRSARYSRSFYRATLKLTVQLPSAPTRRSHIGNIISGPRDEVMSPRSMTPRQPNHSLRIFVTSAFASASLPLTNTS